MDIFTVFLFASLVSYIYDLFVNLWQILCIFVVFTYLLSLCICKRYPSQRFICICCLCVFVRAIPPRDLSPFLCIIGVFAPQSSLHFAASKTMSLISTYLPKPCHWFSHIFQNHVIDFPISSKPMPWAMALISAFLPQQFQPFRPYQHLNCLGRVQLYMMISIFSIFFPLCVLVSSGLLNTNMRKSSCMPFHYIQLPNNTEPFFCPVLPSHMLPALP